MSDELLRARDMYNRLLEELGPLDEEVAAAYQLLSALEAYKFASERHEPPETGYAAPRSSTDDYRESRTPLTDAWREQRRRELDRKRRQERERADARAEARAARQAELDPYGLKHGKTCKCHKCTNHDPRRDEYVGGPTSQSIGAVSGGLPGLGKNSR